MWHFLKERGWQVFYIVKLSGVFWKKTDDRLSKTSTALSEKEMTVKEEEEKGGGCVKYQNLSPCRYFWPFFSCWTGKLGTCGSWIDFIGATKTADLFRILTFFEGKWYQNKHVIY